MNRVQEQVREFHRAFKLATSPAAPELREAEARAKFLLEEAVETVIALVGSLKAYDLVHLHDQQLRYGKVNNITTEPDIVEAIDGLVDTIYIAYGTFETIGVDAEPFVDEVHRSNMAKLGGGVREDGKILKPKNWTPPDIRKVLDTVTVEWCSGAAQFSDHPNRQESDQ